MRRVLLINPPSPERLGAPLLGLQYVAAALLERGCEVRVIDAAARCFDGEHDSLRLTHRARGRGGFALGAVLAGEWVVGRTGIHGFDRVLDDLLEEGDKR